MPVPQFGTNVAFSGVPSINPTLVTNYELDWDRRIPQINAAARAAAFYQTSTSLQKITTARLAPLPNGNLFNVAGNVGNSEELGIELSMTGTFAGGCIGLPAIHLGWCGKTCCRVKQCR